MVGQNIGPKLMVGQHTGPELMVGQHNDPELMVGKHKASCHKLWQYKNRKYIVHQNTDPVHKVGQ